MKCNYNIQRQVLISKWLIKAFVLLLSAPTQIRIYSDEEHELEIGHFFSDGEYKGEGRSVCTLIFLLSRPEIQ